MSALCPQGETEFETRLRLPGLLAGHTMPLMINDSADGDEGTAVALKIGKPEVFRPGLLQYLFLVPPIAFFTVIGIALAIAQPLSGFTFLAVALSLVSGLVLLNLLGMRIELGDEGLTKIYFFGLLRQSISISQLQASRDSGPRESTVWFESADGKGLGFGVIRSAVWRGRDVDKLYEIAVTHERSSTPDPSATSLRAPDTEKTGSTQYGWAEVEPEAARDWRKKRGSVEPSVRADDWKPAENQTSEFIDDPFFIVLSASPGLSVLVGAVIGIQMHSWRSLLAFGAGFACVLPAVPYFRYGNRLPSSRLILWPIRTVVFVLTVGIPLTIWIIVIGVGGVAHDVVTFLGCLMSRHTCG
jgi:hypothetical protein